MSFLPPACLQLLDLPFLAHHTLHQLWPRTATRLSILRVYHARYK